jgi:hypothetical protein
MQANRIQLAISHHPQRVSWRLTASCVVRQQPPYTVLLVQSVIIVGFLRSTAVLLPLVITEVGVPALNAIHVGVAILMSAAGSSSAWG